MFSKVKSALSRFREKLSKLTPNWLKKILTPIIRKISYFWNEYILPVIQLRAVRSLRMKMQIWQFALLGTTISVLLAGFFVYEKKLRYMNLDLELSEPIPNIVPYLKPDKQMRGGGNAHQRQIHLSDGYALPATEDFDPAIRIDKILAEKRFYAYIWNKKKEVIYKTPNAPEFEEFPEDEENTEILWHRWNGDSREAIQFDRGEGWMLVGVRKSVVENELARFQWKLVLIGVCISVVAFSGGWLISGQAIRPIETISETAMSIAEGNLRERIDVAGTDNELGQLAQVLNNTFNRLEVALNRQIQFTADASHELRTPLSIVLNECHWALKQKRDQGDYAASFETCAQTAKHMGGLIESLLQLARIDSGEAKLKIQAEPIDTLVTETLALMQPLAKQKQITLNAKVVPTTTSIDKDKIRQVIINLVSNAIQHSPNESTISVRLHTNEKNLSIDVADTGPGITPTDIPYLFDRFYRSDKARAHDGGSGLGLAISKAIAVAHRGDLSVGSREGIGSVFRLSLPLATETTATS